MTVPALTRPLPFARLIDEALLHTRRHLRRIFLPLGSLLVPVVAVPAVWSAATFTGEIDPAAPQPVGTLLIGILQVVAQWVIFAALGVAAVDAVCGRPVRPWRRLRYVLRPSVLGTLVLAGICTVVAFLFCMVPVLYVAPLLSLTLPAMAVEERLGTAALGRSASLTRYNPRRRFVKAPMVKALALLTVVAVLWWAATMLPSLPIQIAMFRQMFGELSDTSSQLVVQPWVMWMNVPAAIIAGLAQGVVALYSGFAFALLFLDLRERKEARGLEAAVEELERQRGRGEAGPGGGPGGGAPGTAGGSA